MIRAENVEGPRSHLFPIRGPLCLVIEVSGSGRFALFYLCPCQGLGVAQPIDKSGKGRKVCLGQRSYDPWRAGLGGCLAWRGYQILRGLPGVRLGAEHHKRSGLGILARVMVLKVQSQRLLEMPEAVPAIAAKLGPCPPGDLDAIRPLLARFRQAIGPARPVDGPSVKGAVLDDKLLAEKRGDLAQDGRKLWRSPDLSRAYPVQVHVEIGERLFWGNQGAGDMHGPVMPDAGKADLANAR